jgi:hypothetical protein
MEFIMREVFSSATLEQSDFKIEMGLSNPGILYNIGNGIAFCGALLVFAATVPHGFVVQGLGKHFLGNWPAAFTSMATVLFWLGGLKYARAWSHGFPPDATANAAGHALSSGGALLIGFALIGLARSDVALALALVATFMHLGGKLASWRIPDNDCYFKALPLYSRIPYVTALCLDLRAEYLSGASGTALAAALLLPLGLLVAAGFWGRADWLLLPIPKH